MGSKLRQINKIKLDGVMLAVVKNVGTSETQQADKNN